MTGFSLPETPPPVFQQGIQGGGREDRSICPEILQSLSDPLKARTFLMFFMSVAI